MLLFRRFLKVLMKRIINFCKDQQLIVPLAFFAVFETWQVSTGQLTLVEFLKNPWNEFMPYIATIGLFLMIQIGLAARDMNLELREERIKDRPIIIHEDSRFVEPSRWPARAIASVLVGFIVGGEMLAVEHAYPIYLLKRIIPTAPKPPNDAFVAPQPSGPPKPEYPSGFIQWDHAELLDDPSVIASGRRLGFNVYLTNPTSNLVKNPRKQMFFDIDDSTPEGEARVRAKFAKQVMDGEVDYRTSRKSLGVIGAGHGVWSTIGEQALTEDHAKGVLDGTLSVYILWWAKWDDSESTNPSGMGCWWLQKPEPGVTQFTAKNLTWHFCE